MSFSINTNASSLSALQVLQSTQQQRQENQTAINTGLKVVSAKDNAAAFSIVQSIKGDVVAHAALRSSLERKIGLLDVTLNGVDMINDVLVKMNELAVAAADPGLDQSSREALQEDFDAHKRIIDMIANSSEIFGHNLLDSQDSNFLFYGAEEAKIGLADRTNWEPQPGEDIDLSFTFKGGGKSDETIVGEVSFFYTSSEDGNNWAPPTLIETIQVPKGTTISKDGTPYTVSAAPFATPDIPNAKSYQVFAEWSGKWPDVEDPNIMEDTWQNGTHHPIAKWGEYNSKTNTPIIPGGWSTATANGVIISETGEGTSYLPTQRVAGVHLRPDIASTATQTDYGDDFTAGFEVWAPAEGVSQFGAEITYFYEWVDDQGVQHREPTPIGSQSIPVSGIDKTDAQQMEYVSDGNHTFLGQLDDQLEYRNFNDELGIDTIAEYVKVSDVQFTGTLPQVTGPIQASYIVADIEVNNDGLSVPASDTPQRLNDMDIVVSNVTQPETLDGSVQTFLEGIRQGGAIGADIDLNTPDPSITTYDANVSLYLEYFDGASWIRDPNTIDTQSLSGGTATSDLSFSLSGNLPVVAENIEQARVVATIDAVYDATSQPLQTVEVLTWDASSTTTSEPSTLYIEAWSEPLFSNVQERSEEHASTIKWLDESNGYNRSLRESNLGTSGLNGLYLSNTNLLTTSDAQSAVSAIQSAMNKVNALAGYYGAEYNRTSNMLDFEVVLSDVLETGIGNLVDADLAKESAKSQALQVKEQLGLQALGIANRSSELILSLFNK